MTLAQWEDYWRTGAAVSCPTDSLGGCSGSLRSLWEKFFEPLPSGARALDIGTGNGALPLIALDVARRRSVTLEVHGIDLARIDPRRNVPDGARLFENAVFHGGISADAMPFAPGYFDAVSGQYVLEYTQREAVLREVRRVMVVGASARFVLHHASSVVVRNARESLLHARELEDRATAFADLREFVAAERNDPPRAARVYARMTERMQQLHALAEESKGSNLLAGVLLPALGNLYERRQQMSAANFNAAIDATHRSFKATEQRLRELVDAALDKEGMSHLAELARGSGFRDAQFEPQWQDAEYLVGWRLDMTAAAASHAPGSVP
jgi:ubiquinone/menaquinone biosynthesis C-methylase UbiE